MNTEQLQLAIEGHLRDAGLLSAVVPQKSQYLDLLDRTFVELILNDASRQEEISQLVGDLLKKVDQAKSVSLAVHPIWVIERIGDPEVAISESGGIVAARIVPVWLKSGSERTEVRVAVTYLAEMELRRANGRDTDLKPIVRTYIENLLKWGGESYWDPRKHNYLEVSAERALDLQRILRKTA